MRAVCSTDQDTFGEIDVAISSDPVDLAPGAIVTGDFKGFGICFNELGWIALQCLNPQLQREILTKTFSETEGCGFNYCRVPIGANDYSESWYSHAEVEGDYALKHFSITRDHQHLIPFLQAARAVRGKDFHLFATPWSPPIWMKQPRAYNHGRLIWTDQVRRSYADYFVRFVMEYENLGLPIQAVHVQNEPDSDQKFPSCCWTGDKLSAFIRDDLGPAFRNAGKDTEIWLGTIERGSFNDWVAPTLLDSRTMEFVSGLGFQWAGKHAVQRSRQAAPGLPIIQTENECGDGENTWAYAHYVFDLMQHYLSNGAEAYVYWNLVLEKGGISTWGWRQNSLFSVDPATGTYEANPEFHLLRHFAEFVRPGASVLATSGRWAANAVMFRNADGCEVAVLQNPDAVTRTVRVAMAGQTVSLDLAPKSFTTLVA
jgi:glucosylceramidase